MLNHLIRSAYTLNHHRNIVDSISKNKLYMYLTKQLNDETAVDVYLTKRKMLVFLFLTIKEIYSHMLHLLYICKKKSVTFLP